MTSRALLFDVDGTLVDSTYTHVMTWWRALDSVGVTVPHADIHRRIGMDGSRLVSELLVIGGADPDARDELASQASSLHSEFFAGASDLLRPLPGARDLVRGAHEAGWRTVLATSASPEEFERARKLLDVDDAIDAVTNGEDVDEAKPNPDVVAIALERAGVETRDAVMIGDATWDAIAARKLGVRSVSVLTGGIGEAELREAGSDVVVDDAAAVLAMLDRL